MVADPRTPVGAHALRALGAPTQLTVYTGAGGCPAKVQRPHWRAPRPVQAILDEWRIDDEWWRDTPIARWYYLVCLEDGSVLSLYHDLLADEWCEQRG